MGTGKFMKKTALALALLCAAGLGFSALTDSSTYAADAIDVTAKCTVKVDIEVNSEGTDTAFQNDLKAMVIPVKLYRVATVDAAGRYTVIAPFSGNGLNLSGISDKTTTDDWKAYAETAAEVVEEQEEQGEGITPAADIQVTDGTGTATGLDTGMYVVIPQETYNADYSYLYRFTPYLTALPGNNYYNDGNDEWNYNPTIGLKPEREIQYGSLEIVKTLDSYNDLTQEGYFVFQIEGEKDGVQYSNVASISFTDGDETAKTTVVTGIPVGMEVTVTEVYSGASYELVTANDQTATIVADEMIQAGTSQASVTFENKDDGKLIPGTGVLNVFTAPEGEGDWNWSSEGGTQTE